SAPGFVYSVGLSPADTAAALTALRVMLREPERVARLRGRADEFLSAARAAGLNTGASQDSAVIPIVVGESARAFRMAQALFDAGVSVHPITYPAVDEKSARLRFLVTAMHTSEQLHGAVDALVAYR